MTSPVLVWFRHDLRLHDNPALVAAAALEQPLVAVYILDPTIYIGGASKWWLHHSLAHLQKKLQDKGISLIIRQGFAEEILQELVQDLQINEIFWNRRYDPQGIEIDTRIKKNFTEQAVACHSFNSHLLFEPWAIKTQQGKPFQVFTPFWKACLSFPNPASPQSIPLSLKGYPTDRDSINDLQLLPLKIDWAGGLRQTWQPGEDYALDRFYQFLDERVAGYKDKRDYPGQAGTSGLSPHLMWGEISPRLIYQETMRWLIDHPASNRDAETFLTEIGWREFSYYLLYHYPCLPTQPLRDKFLQFPWASDAHLFKAWTQGQTGYPIVDAGMRQLWQTGWTHNRVRMIVASFLVKDLLISWQEGAAWFLDTLVDADLASNSANWQWVAGCGTDAAPYFRVFNPVLQGGKFDPDGSYVYQWVPELKNLSTKWVHQPWTAPSAELLKAGIELGSTYPHPLVHHDAARQRALALFKNLSDT